MASPWVLFIFANLPNLGRLWLSTLKGQDLGDLHIWVTQISLPPPSINFPTAHWNSKMFWNSIRKYIRNSIYNHFHSLPVMVDFPAHLRFLKGISFWPGFFPWISILRWSCWYAFPLYRCIIVPTRTEFQSMREDIQTDNSKIDTNSKQWPPANQRNFSPH